MRNIRREAQVMDALDAEQGRNRPSWYSLAASYLRGFRRTRHSPTSDLLPQDRRITAAARRLYRRSDPVSRSVMDGSSTLQGRERSQVFNRLVHQLAVEAGLTAAALMPPEMEENK